MYNMFIRFILAKLYLTVIIPVQHLEYAAANSNICLSSLTQSKCQAKKQYLEFDLTKNACPRCRGGLGFGISGCNFKNSRRKCAPGLNCVNSQCLLDKSSCFYSHHLRYLRNVPECQIDGTFAAKQCKGDMLSGRCFCADERGKRIFGFSWRKDAATMNCACSRQRAILQATGRHDVTLHCSANGNYEPLQCDQNICWCMDVETGRTHPQGRAVPASMWRTLPCYRRAEMGDIYIRQCESIRLAQAKQQMAMSRRGTDYVSVQSVACTFDGSYGPYRIENGIAACITANGKRIDSFQDSANAIALQNCNCAMDRVIFREVGSELPFACAGNGNYNSIQTLNGRALCVDADGFPTTELKNASHNLECNQYLYDLVTEPDE